MRKKIIVLSLLLVSLYSFSQVHGFVKDNAGQIIPGAHVRWLGSETGTVTDADGHFHIGASPSASLLVFSSVGFEADTVNVTNRNTQDHLNIVLQDNNELKEVTVTQRRSGKMVNRLSINNMETLNTNELRKAAL